MRDEFPETLETGLDPPLPPLGHCFFLPHVNLREIIAVEDEVFIFIKFWSPTIFIPTFSSEGKPQQNFFWAGLYQYKVVEIVAYKNQQKQEDNGHSIHI